jgi:hypothetical protein
MRQIPLILLVVGPLILCGLMWQRSSAQVEQARQEADLARLQREYLERVGWMRAHPDAEGWKRELSPFFRVWFSGLEEHRKRFGQREAWGAYLEELERSGAGKEGKEAELRALYQQVREVFDQMREGRYQPLWTAADKGLRLDVLSAERVVEQGTPKVSMRLVLWGAWRELREEGRVRRVASSASFATQWRLLDERGRLVGEMSAEDPSSKVDWPERFIADFPPQMILGRYDLDRLPAQVAKLETIFKVRSRTAWGSPVESEFVWRTEVPEDWRLRPGETWEGAKEEVRSEEEINSAGQGR